MVPGDERNMKVTEPIDVYLADKLFQLTGNDLPGAAQRRTTTARRSPARRWWSSAAATASAPTSPSWPRRTAPTSRRTAARRTKPTSSAASDIAAAARGRASSGSARSTSSSTPPACCRAATLIETSEETIYAATEINYIAPILIAQEFHPLLRETQGSLLLFTSSSYTRGRSGYSLYSSAKAATVNLTQALADEWAADGVRVNCINPERTGTPMRTKAFGEEPPGSLLESEVVARTSLDVLHLRLDRAHRRRPQGRPDGDRPRRGRPPHRRPEASRSVGSGPAGPLRRRRRSKPVPLLGGLGHPAQGGHGYRETGTLVEGGESPVGPGVCRR